MLGPALPFEISEILQKVEVKYSYRQCLSGTLQVLNIFIGGIARKTLGKTLFHISYILQEKAINACI